VGKSNYSNGYFSCVLTRVVEPIKRARVHFCLNVAITEYLSVCTFEKGSSRKGHHVVSRKRISTLETMEVSDASSHYMSGSYENRQRSKVMQVLLDFHALL
jgi:hypothetical protein